MSTLTTGQETYEILLVEDNIADAQLMKIAFQHGHFLANLHIVGDGETALAFLNQEDRYGGAALPDLVLLDLNLPRMDGRTLLRRIRALPQFEGLKLVVLSSSKLETDIREVMDLNAKAYLVKPLDLYGFFRLVENLQNYLTHNHPLKSD